MTRRTGLDGYADAAAPRTVLIVDDHPLYRSGLKTALAPLSVEFGEAASLLAAIDALEQRRVDLILYDWHLPDSGGCRGLAAIRHLAPGVPVVVISADDDEAVQIAAASMGAADFMSKATDAQRMREVLCGLLCDAARPPQRAPRSSVAALTRRQHDVLQLMARGDSNKRIADRLGIAETTVRAHVSDILEVTRSRNRTEAVVRAQREGLVGAGRRHPEPRARSLG